MKGNTDKKADDFKFLDLSKIPKLEILASVFSLDVYTKTITLIGGPSECGKTVTCLHFANECIKKGKTVCYFDTDDHPTMERPRPNLLRGFISKNEGKYQKNFKYSNTFSEEAVFSALDTFKPALLVIDSIYVPYVNKYPKESRSRAKAIRMFLHSLRDKMRDTQTAILLTSQVSKEKISTANGNHVMQDQVILNILGGEGLKHLSDCKWIINFSNQQGGEKTSKLGKRIILIDSQQELVLSIDSGGVIEKAG